MDKKEGKKSVVQSSFYFHCICNGYVGHIPGRLWRLLRGGKIFELSFDAGYGVSGSSPLSADGTAEKKLAVITAIASGVFSSLATVFIMSKLFGFTHEQYVTLLPKSITTAIGMGVSEKLEGIVTVTVVVIIITGILGNVIAEGVFKLFRIQNPIAKGLALGTSAHAIGTAKAMELGEIEGAMSSLSIVVSGILTVAAAPLFAGLL